MPRFLLRLYLKSDPDVHPGELLGEVEVEAENVWKAEDRARDHRAAFPPATNFGVLYDADGAPFIPLDFRQA